MRLVQPSVIVYAATKTLTCPPPESRHLSFHRRPANLSFNARQRGLPQLTEGEKMFCRIRSFLTAIRKQGRGGL